MKSYDPELYQRLIEVESRHFWFRARNEAILAAFELIRPNLQVPYRMLEVGCGTGNVLSALSSQATGGVVYGMDQEIAGLQIARRRVANGMLVVGDARRPPFSVTFELLGAFDVIEHIDDDVDALIRMRELVGPGGYLMLTVPANPRLWSYFDVAAHHRRRYDETALRERLLSAGFEVEYLTRFMSVLTPAVWAGRRFAGWRGRTKAMSPASLVEADLQPPPLVGAALALLLKPEVRLIKRRVHLPTGTSLLAIARRS